jgi:hypothetical protein
VLANLRRLYANLDQQIVQMENGAIPTELGVEIAFAAGGLAGGAAGGAGTCRGRCSEDRGGHPQDVLKGVVKSSINAGGAAADSADTLTNLRGGALGQCSGHARGPVHSDYLNATMGGHHTSVHALGYQLP